MAQLASGREPIEISTDEDGEISISHNGCLYLGRVKGYTISARAGNVMSMNMEIMILKRKYVPLNKKTESG